MNIVGEKVILRGIEESDLETLRGWYNEPEVAGLLGSFSWPVSSVQQERWFQRSLEDERTRRLAVKEKASGEFVGLVGLWNIDWIDRRAFTGIIISPRMQGRGLGTAAMQALMELAFDQLQLERLYTEVLTTNAASIKLHQDKLGWTKEGCLRRHVFRHGCWHDSLVFGILSNEYRERMGR